MNKFYLWLTGFVDGEGYFNISPTNRNGKITNFNFIFKLSLHIEDIQVLEHIRYMLNMGRITKDINRSECSLTITKLEDINNLINIFDKYKLNSTKYLDYLDFKDAYNLYVNRVEYNEELVSKIILLKNKMNNNRTDFNIYTYENINWAEHINISKYWLLGLIEGEGSFNFWRDELKPTFALVLTEVQLPLLLKIKTFLIKEFNLDEYSLFKMNNTSTINLNYNKARNNSKPSYRLLIKNIWIMNNYFMPFILSMKDLFISKKYNDFKILSLLVSAVYYGLHLNPSFSKIMLKLSYNMNNYCLSNNTKLPPKELFTNESNVNVVDYTVNKVEKDLLVFNTENNPIFKHLEDGRILNLLTNTIVRNKTSCIYKVSNFKDDNIHLYPVTPGKLFITLADVAKFIGIRNDKLSRLFKYTNSENYIIYNTYKIERVRVFYKNIYISPDYIRRGKELVNKRVDSPPVGEGRLNLD